MIIQRMLKESFAKHREKAALITDEYEISYAELFHKVCILSNYMTNKFGSQRIVSLIFVSPDYYVYGMTGALFSNNIFMPMDSAHPAGKLLEQINISKCEILITEKKISSDFIEAITERGISLVYIEDIIESNSHSLVYDLKDAGEDDAVYIYFTSGSTGVPKGILGKNKSLCHFINWEIEEFNVTAKDIFVQMTSPAFDPYLRDVFVPLCSGAAVRFADRKIVKVPRLFNKFLHNNNITFLHTTPTILKYLVASVFADDYFKTLRYILIAGEELPPGLVTSWYNNYTAGTQLVNLYGPTETTLAKVFARIPSVFSGDHVPVGKAIDGSEIHIINSETGYECGADEIGEVCIDTEFTTHGYLCKGNDGSTFKATGKIGINRYTTGDLGYLHGDNLYLLGRKDDQLKIGGVRIHLKEISHKITSFHDKSITDCAVLYTGGNLIAFYVSPFDIDIEKLKSFLKTRLMQIHIPNKFIRLKQFPATVNGKLDKDELLAEYCL